MAPIVAVLRGLPASVSVLVGLSLCAPSAGAACLWPQNRFVVKGSEVYEPSTRITWQRCSLGQTFAKGLCRGSGRQLPWAAAEQAATAAGPGWRLPTQAELQTLLLSDCSSPATDTTVFPGTESGWYWSSSPNGDLGAWFTEFQKGGGGGMTLRTNLAYVRLVRTGKE